LKTLIKWLAVLVLLGAIAGGIFVFSARSGWLTPSDADLRARYSVPGSQFADIDGQSIHYVDEGRGDAIVLIHGSFGSLRMWNDWARTLSARYRVIRFDRPPMGLSGAEPQGRYDTDREMRVIEGLTAKLGVDRFFLVATSSGGMSGVSYAAAHPQQIRGLVLSNIAVGPFKTDLSHFGPGFKLLLKVDPWFKGWHPQEFWRQIFLANFHDPSKITPELVREWTELNNRAQRMPPAPNSRNPYLELTRTPADLPRIAAPTLFLWSQNDPEVTVDAAGRKGLALSGATDKALVIVPNCGHMMPLECSAESVVEAQKFFDRLSAAGAPAG